MFNRVPKPIKKFIRKNKLHPVGQLISTEELEPHYNKACATLKKNIGNDAIGDYLEFGVCYGTSLYCMHQVLAKNGLDHVRLFGFDSFEGLPEYAPLEDEGVWKAGEFYSNYKTTYKTLDEKGVDWKKTFLIKGWYSDSLTKELVQKYKIKKASLVMIDCDMYSSAKEALNFSAPLIIDQTVIFFDDWNSNDLAQKNMGEKKAFDEFLTENPNLTSKEIGTYNYNGYPNGKIFLVTNTLSV